MKHLSLGLLLLLPFLAVAQDDYYQPRKQPVPVKRTYTIVLTDGTQLRGEVVRQDSSEAIIRTSNRGEIRLRADQIARMEPVGAQAGGEIFPNLFSQTMGAAPTAFSAERGKVYFRNYMVYISQFDYGVTDNWSVGTSFLSILPTALFSLNTKVSLPVSGRVRLGVNAQYVALTGLISGNGLADVGYVQGIVTTGDRQNNTTFGFGWGVSNGDLSRSFVGTFGLVRKVSPKLTFITENFALLGQGTIDFAGVLSAGVRFDRWRHAFNLSAYIPLVVGPRVTAPITLIPFAAYHLKISK